MVIKLAFFPTQPIPDFLAQAFSRTGAESTKILKPNPPISDCNSDTKFFRISLNKILVSTILEAIPHLITS